MLTEKTLFVSIKAALTRNATHDILDALARLAGLYIKRGETQEGADILAYVLRCDDAPTHILDSAQDLWDDLERYICPRVLLDAEDFGIKANLNDVIEYAFAGT